MSYYIDERELSTFSSTTLLEFSFKGEPYEKTHELRKCHYCGASMGLLQRDCGTCSTRVKGDSAMKLANIVRDWRYKNDSLYRRKYDAEQSAQKVVEGHNNNIAMLVALPIWALPIIAFWPADDNGAGVLLALIAGGVLGIFPAIIAFLMLKK